MPVEARVGLLRRYLLRRDLVRKVKARARNAHRQLTRSELKDAERLFAHRAPHVIFDVGANIGYVAADFRRTFPKSQIHAFEPTPETFRALSDHLGNDENVTLHQVAVTDQSGSVTFHADNQTYGGGANSLLDHNAAFMSAQPKAAYEDITVEAVTLDELCAARDIEHIDIVKLDIEGAEHLALQGAAQLLAAGAIDMIMSEVRAVAHFEGQLRFHELVGWLDEQGYALFSVHRFAQSRLGQAGWGNAVFISKRFREELLAEHGAAYCGWGHDS